eukprot:gene9182-10156_t
MSSTPPTAHKEDHHKIEKEEFHVPRSPRKLPFLIPSPVPCRRTRTTSQSRIASDSPVETGVITEFSRSHGHGFVKADSEEEKHYFVHISDVEGEYVPQNGDKVEYRTIFMPPKLTEKQAVEVKLIKMGESKHERWAPLN